MWLKKLLIFFLIVGVAILSAGLFGVFHDQITYSISSEYYTKFKFLQFGLMDHTTEANLPNLRLKVSIVGLMATWWVGMYIGIVFGMTGLLFKNHQIMLIAILKAIIITFCITVLCSIVGYIYGTYVVDIKDVDWWFPDNLIHKRKYVSVGYIHNFSYLGGAIGLIVGVVYLIIKNHMDSKNMKFNVA